MDAKVTDTPIRHPEWLSETPAQQMMAGPPASAGASQEAIVMVGGPSFCSALGPDIGAATNLRVAVVPTVEAAHQLVQAGTVDTLLVVVDARVLGPGDLALCADMARTANQQIVVIDQEDSEAMALESLQAGAVDYFPRPHNRAELSARMRAHLRNRTTSLEVDISIGPFVFRPGQRALLDRRTQKRIWLTVKEARLLRQLHLANGRSVPARVLMMAAWDPASNSVHTLHTHVYRLRNKLSIQGAEPMLLTTRDGYSLVPLAYAS